MSSFRWGIIAPQLQQTAKWQSESWGNPLFSHHFSTVVFCCFASCFGWVAPGSANIPLHFGPSLSHSLEHIKLPYLFWKKTQIPLILPQLPLYYITNKPVRAPVLIVSAQASYFNRILTSKPYFRGTGHHALLFTSPNSKMSKLDVVKLILFVSITLHSCPCLRNLSFGHSFCCRSTNSMYRPSGSQYFLVRICLPCHPHLPCRPFASRLVERTEDTQLFFHLVFWVLFSVSLLLSSGEIIWWIHWKYDDFPGPMRLPLAML